MKEYQTFAKRFPALVHTCGLAQAIAFALAKKEQTYVTDLASVLQAGGHSELADADALDQAARVGEALGLSPAPRCPECSRLVEALCRGPWGG